MATVGANTFRTKATRMIRILRNHPQCVTRKWNDQSLKYTPHSNTNIAKEEGVCLDVIHKDVEWLRKNVKHCGTCGAMLIPQGLIDAAADGVKIEEDVERVKPQYPVLLPQKFTKLTRESATRRWLIWQRYGNPFELEGWSTAKHIASEMDCSPLMIVGDIEWLQHHMIICEECGLLVGVKDVKEAMLVFEDKSRS